MKSKINRKVRMLILTVIILILGIWQGIFALAETTNIDDTFDETDSVEVTAYRNQSYTEPLTIYMKEKQFSNTTDYYYATYAYYIWKINVKVNPIYENCKEVIVIVETEKSSEVDEAVYAYYKLEPQIKTGYLNHSSLNSSRIYTIDNIVITVQRK